MTELTVNFGSVYGQMSYNLHDCDISYNLFNKVDTTIKWKTKAKS